MALNHQQDVAEMLENKVCASVVGKRTHFSFPLEFIISLNCLKQHERYILSSSAANCPFSWTSFFLLCKQNVAACLLFRKWRATPKNLLCLYSCAKSVVFLKQKTPQQKTIDFDLYKMQDLFYNLEMMPTRAEGEKETNTSQNEWQEGNKNSCQSISQCKIYYIHSVSSYLHGHEQTGSVFPKPKWLTCLTVCITYKTNHCCKDEEERWIT